MEKINFKTLLVATLLSFLTLTGCNEVDALDDQDSQEEIESIVDEETPLPEDNEVIEEGPQVPWYKVSKPSDKDSDQVIVDKCYKLGQRDASFKINNFLIAFEGLASFSSSQTEDIYEAFENDPNLSGLEVPRKKSGGFMVNYLLWPVLMESEASTDFVVFPEPSIKTDEVGAKPDLCARAWLKGNPNGKLFITGHSYGGHAANQLADVLDQQDVPVDTVITVDPRTKRYVGDLFKTSNAKYWINFYQRNTLFLFGYVVEGADENNNLSSTRISHGKIPSRPEVQQALFNVLNN